MAGSVCISDGMAITPFWHQSLARVGKFFLHADE